MVIFISKEDYMSVSKCSLSTYHRRIRGGVLSPCTLLGVKGVFYDTDMWHSEWHKNDTDMTQCRNKNDTLVTQERPNIDTLVTHGVNYSVLIKCREDACSTSEVTQPWHKNDTLVTQPWHKNDTTVTQCRNKNDTTGDTEQLSSRYPDEYHRLVSLLCTMNKLPDASKLTGYIHLHRRLLKHPIMADPLLSYVFIELLLLANEKGDVNISFISPAAKALGIDKYVVSLMALKQDHDVISIEPGEDGIKVRVLKWANYQKNEPTTGIVIRDMDNPELRIVPGDAAPEENPLSHSPLDDKINNINISLPYVSSSEAGDTKEKNNKKEKSPLENAMENTTTPPPLPQKEKKQRSKKQQLSPPKSSRDLDSYPEEYRMYVPDAIEIYDYYRSLVPKPGNRKAAVMDIASLMTVYRKEEIIQIIDNYKAEMVRRNTEYKYYTAPEYFFKKKYEAYLPDEFAAIMPAAIPTRSTTRPKANAPKAEVIKVTAQNSEVIKPKEKENDDVDKF